MRCIRLAEWTGTLRRTIGFQPTRARQARLFFVYPSVVAGAGGDAVGSATVYVAGRPVDSMEKGFVYGEQASLGRTTGCVTVVSGAGAAARAHPPGFPYLTRRSVDDFVYGESEGLGAMLNCMFYLDDAKS